MKECHCPCYSWKCCRLWSLIESLVIEFIYVLNYCNYQSFELLNRLHCRQFSSRLIRELGRVAQPKSYAPSSSKIILLSHDKSRRLWITPICLMLPWTPYSSLELTLSSFSSGQVELPFSTVCLFTLPISGTYLCVDLFACRTSAWRLQSAMGEQKEKVGD